jgi:histamine N-methyltransferase
MLTWFRKFTSDDLKEKDSTNCSILSVGAGNGNFDLLAMAKLKHKFKSLNYVAVEPNKALCLQFKTDFDYLGIPGIDLAIVHSKFEEYEPKKSFDLIHFTHCLYHIPDRSQALTKALAHLKKDGSLFIINSTAVGLQNIRMKFSERIKGRNSDIFTAEELHTILQVLDIPYIYEEIPSAIDVSECVDPALENGVLLLDFILECDTRNMKPDRHSEIVHYIKSVSYECEGRLRMPHPLGIFKVSPKKHSAKVDPTLTAP